MNSMYKLLCLAAAVLCSSSGFAQAASGNLAAQSNCKKDCPVINCPKKTTTCDPFEQGMELPCGKYPCAYNAPAGICLRNAWDFNISGSFIYWYASQDDMDIAYSAPILSADPAVARGGAVAFQTFNYEPGFKVGLGFNTDYDSWAFKAEYTWLHETQNTGILVAPLTTAGAAGVWSEDHWFSDATTDFASVSSRWRLKLDMVDAGMTRPFYQGTRLTITPFGGLRGLWLRQKMNVTGYNASDVVIATSNNRSNSWGVGPATGVGGHWLLGAGFRFEGNAMASLLYTRYTKISTTETVGGFVPVTSTVRDLSAVRPIAQLNVGLGWGTYFHGCSSDWYLDISLDYEFLEFWHQNVMRTFASNLSGHEDDRGDLTMHGLTATVRFDF